MKISTQAAEQNKHEREQIRKEERKKEYERNAARELGEM